MWAPLCSPLSGLAANGIPPCLRAATVRPPRLPSVPSPCAASPHCPPFLPSLFLPLLPSSPFLQPLFPAASAAPRRRRRSILVPSAVHSCVSLTRTSKGPAAPSAAASYSFWGSQGGRSRRADKPQCFAATPAERAALPRPLLLAHRLFTRCQVQRQPIVRFLHSQMVGGTRVDMCMHQGLQLAAAQAAGRFCCRGTRRESRHSRRRSPDPRLQW